MGILLQPGHVIHCPHWTCPGHQFVRSPEGLWEPLCCDSTTVQPKEFAGLAEDVLDLPQDQILLNDPTLCGLEERHEMPVDRGSKNFRCGFGYWAPPATQRDDSFVLSNAVMRRGSAKSLRQSRFRFQMISSKGSSSDRLGGWAKKRAAAPMARMKSSTGASEGSSAKGTCEVREVIMLRV
jgi:hypothetical protein